MTTSPAMKCLHRALSPGALPSTVEALRAAHPEFDGWRWELVPAG